MKSATPPAVADNLSNWAALEAAKQKQSAARAEYLSSDDGKAVVAALDKRDYVERLKTTQLAAPLSNVLEQEAVLRELDDRLLEIDCGIISKDQLQQQATGAEATSTKASAADPRSARARPAASRKLESAASHTVHVLGRRRDVLSAVIDSALARAIDHADPHAAWNSFVELALTVPPPAPLRGFKHGEVTYTGGKINKASFIKRVKRNAAKNR